MDRSTHSRLPFMAAFMVALMGMPLDIFNYSQREVGFAKLNPWQRKLSSAVERISALSGRLLALIRTPRFWQTAVAAAVLILSATNHLHAHGAVMCAGITAAAEVREKINKMGVDMRAMTQKVKDENREDMNADEVTTFNKIDKDREALLEREARLLKMEALEREEEGVGRRSEPQMSSGREHEARGQKAKRGRDLQDEMDAMRAWICAGSPVHPDPQYRQAAEKLGINPFSKYLMLKAPKHTMRSLRPEDQKAWQERAMSTLSTTSPEDGSYLIANEMMQPLERARLAFGGVRQAATVKRTNTGAAYPTPTSDDTSNKGALLSENTIAVEKDVEFGQMVLNAFKWTSKKLLVSLELMQDSNEDLAATIGAALGERIGRIENDYFTTGSGSSQPNGIVTAATSSGTTLAAKTPTYLELVATEGSVDPAYRVGASWMFPDSELQEIKKIVETTTGRPIWLPNMAGGAPDSILGYPYYINQSMDAASGSGSGKSILFGLLSKYIVRDVREIVLMRLDELYAEYYQVAFVAFARSDGDLLDAGTHPVKYTANHS